MWAWTPSMSGLEIVYFEDPKPGMPKIFIFRQRTPFRPPELQFISAQLMRNPMNLSPKFAPK